MFKSNMFFFFSPSSSGQVAVNKPLPQNLLMEELIGQQHQKGGHSFKQDVVGDVATENRHMTNINADIYGNEPIAAVQYSDFTMVKRFFSFIRL